MDPQTQTSSNQSRNSLAIPIAIVLAGIIIAGAVYLRGPSAGTTTDDFKAESAEINIAAVSNKDHILGSPSAPITIVEYSDTECPFCKNFQKTMEQISAEYGKNGQVAWVYRHFPIVQLHSRAPFEAEATECAAELGGESKFWEYINKVFEVTPANNGLDPAQLSVIAVSVGLDKAAFQKCLDSGKYTEKINQSVEEAKTAGAQGTPYSVLIYNKAIPKKVIDRVDEISLNLKFPPGTFTFSPDKTKLAISGALPYEVIAEIVDVIIENK